MNSAVITTAEMRAAEERAFAAGTNADALMEAAGHGIARAIARLHREPGRCVSFVGKGHNGGDAAVAARALRARGWNVELRLIFPQPECSELTCEKVARFHQAEKNVARPSESGALVFIDGLLGVGAKLPLREPIRAACRELNARRLSERAQVFAADLPSGLESDSGVADPDCVLADCTLTIGFAKAGLVADSALGYVGRLIVVPLPGVDVTESPSAGIVATPDTLRSLLPPRRFGAYKNQFGYVGILAGSRGLTGAAVLCALGALRGGAGLVRLYVNEEIYPVIAAAAPPEAMVEPIKDYLRLLDEKIDVWAIGPGLGQREPAELLPFMRDATQPMVIDADALNMLDGNRDLLAQSRGPRLLTPHPGEMKRLDPSGATDRAERVRAFTDRYPVTLLLKGSRTLVGEKEHSLSYNTTGTPAMCTGGIGDILTGVCAALLGQKLTPYDAARLGAWVCGRAAEIVIDAQEESEQSFVARDLVDRLGTAFLELQTSASP